MLSALKVTCVYLSVESHHPLVEEKKMRIRS
jgi:hypothetical protein